MPHGGNVKREFGLLRKEDTISLSPTGMQFTEDTDFKSWSRKGREIDTYLRIYRDCIPWWLGDWLNYGSKKYGEKYSQALEDTMYSAGHLRNVAWVCANVPFEMRRERLSFAHHTEVAMLPSDLQDTYLTEAETNRWGVKQLRARVRGLAIPEDKCVPDIIKRIERQRHENFEVWYRQHEEKLSLFKEPKEAYQYVWMEARS